MIGGAGNARVRTSTPATDDPALVVRQVGGVGITTVGTQSIVAASASSVTLLEAAAAGTLRGGACIYNDPAGGAGAHLYVLCSDGTASTTVFTVRVVPDAYYEVPFGYQGKIVGIWTSADGAARITLFT